MSDLNFEGLTDAQLRLFAVLSARQVRHLMTDPRSIAALDVAVRHLKGEATDEELAAARDAAQDAAQDAPWAAQDGSWDAARAAAGAVAAEAKNAARAAAISSEWAAYWDGAPARAEQQKILDEIRGAKP